MKEYSLVGKRVPRIDSLPKAIGAAKYFADIALPRMLYGKILRSPYPHAKILNIDTSKAVKLLGVKAVVTGKDTAGVKFGIYPESRDQYLLAIDKVRYVGEEVAAVAAIDEDVAEEALNLIEVEYEELPTVFDPVEAMKDGAPEIHEGVDRNIGWNASAHFGDVEEGFRQSDLIRQDRFVSLKVCHCQMEPYGALASFDPSGKLDMWIPNQSPFTRRRALSNALRMPLGKVRVHRCYIGGAFGGRSDTFPAEFCAALLSIKAGMPVRIAYSRQETMVATRHKHSMIIDLKTGVKRDGTIMAEDMEAVLDGGAYLSSGPIACGVPLIHVEAVYRTPNLRYNGNLVYTNKTPTSMMRTHPSAMHLAKDVQLDMIAEELGMDPMEIRLKNAIKPGERLPSKSVVTSCGLTETIYRAAEEAGWKEKRGKLGTNRGIGMACGLLLCGWNMGFRTLSAAFIKFNEDGGASLFTGNVDNGQGNESMLVQIAAEELGLRMEDIELVCADTELTPQDPGSFSMTSAFVSGNAVKAAAADARQQLLKIAADRLGVDIEALEARDRRIYVKENPGIEMRIRDAAILSLLKGTPILGKGSFMPNVEGWADHRTGKYEGQQSGAYTFGTIVAEVEIDRETGLVKVVDLVAGMDVGVAINPMAVEGQMQGIAAMMIGEALSEKHAWDEKNGRLVTDSFLDYKIPAAIDVPKIKPIIVETIDPVGPYGAKEAGINCGVAVCGAIANAIYDAIGVRIKELPITPENILNALKENEKLQK